MIQRFSLRTRIFIAMIFIVIMASVLIAVITIYQFNEQAEEYHNKRLERKEEAIKSAITYELKREPIARFGSILLPKVLDDKLNEISDIHNLDINIYDLDGNLLRSSYVESATDTTGTRLSVGILEQLKKNPNHRLVLPKSSPDGKKFKSAFSYIDGNKDKPVGIIGVPYLQDNTFQDEELQEFLTRLSAVYMVILLVAITLAYFLSKYITKSLENVSRRMRQTTVDRTNQKITLGKASQEIHNLVEAYNSMIDQIEDSAVQLAQSERKHAWREMAKQVAHEIKNPLTPMRLTVQSFYQNFDPKDPEVQDKMKEFTDSLIQQIDTMSSIASAFSNFAQMPKPNREELNVNEEVKKALDIFHENYIRLIPADQNITLMFDKIQLTRIVTNLITNSIQALEDTEAPHILVRVRKEEGQVLLEVEDNGIGIAKEDENKVFEPKFTTKSSGMGLGLPMVKNIVEAYNGDIWFVTEPRVKTVFSVSLPS